MYVIVLVRNILQTRIHSYLVYCEKSTYNPRFLAKSTDVLDQQRLEISEVNFPSPFHKTCHPIPPRRSMSPTQDRLPPPPRPRAFYFGFSSQRWKSFRGNLVQSPPPGISLFMANLPAIHSDELDTLGRCGSDGLTRVSMQRVVLRRIANSDLWFALNVLIIALDMQSVSF